MRTAIYPGTFDPVTNGHVDVIHRAADLFDNVIVMVAVNASKTPLFTSRERVAMISEIVKGVKGIEVASYDGLLVDYARKRKAMAIIRGLRAISDFEFEFQLALMNRKLEPEVDTVFLMPHEKYTYLNSTIVREIARLGGDISQFVPENVAKALRKKFKNPS
jgi:pantetheine-phosphate adenylyltransferase